MNISIKKKDLIWSYLSTFTSLTSNIITLPLIVYFLTSEIIGLWYVFVSIGAISVLFDFGFTVTFARNITYCWCGVKKLKKQGVEVVEQEQSEPDFKLMYNILLTCKRIYFLLSITLLVILLTLGTWYINHISGDFQGYSHLYAWVIYCIGIFLNLYYNYYGSFLRGVGAIDIANRNMVIARLVQILMMVALLTMGMGLLGLALATVAYGTTFRILSKSKFYNYKGIRTKLEGNKVKFNLRESFELFKTVWYNAWRDGLIQLSSYISGQANVLICSFYLPLNKTGVYSLSVQIITALASLSSVLYSVYQPELQSECANKQKEKIQETMAKIVPPYTYCFAVGLLLVLVVGIPVIHFIKPSMVLSPTLLIGISIGFYLINLRNCYTSYFSCTNRIIYVKSFILSSLIGLLLALLFLSVFKWDVWGLIWSTILSQMLFNVWYWPIKAHREMGMSISNMFSRGNIYIKETLITYFRKK